MYYCHKVQLIRGIFGGEDNTAIGTVKAITNNSSIGLKDSILVS